MISVSAPGNFMKTTARLNRLKQLRVLEILNRYGDRGVTALQMTTPIDSGETATSWYYEVNGQNGKYSLAFKNRNIVDGAPIAILLQYGHGTRNGGYVVGRDYINPAIKPIFDQILADVRREVASL